jgi:4-diphosphocytidyl-2-C-methyl-D-erythritol kinase
VEELQALAKINLRLLVTGRRSDGYHHLSMLNACTTLADRIWIQLTSDGKITLTERKSGVARLPQDSARTETNLASRAAASFFKRFSPGTGARIEIEKNIPSGAGLGGGSSDAAAVLRYLWRACEHSGEAHELYEIAAMLGADIPFLLYGGLAVARGVGEKLVPLAGAVRSFTREGATTPIAIVLPSWSIPTPALFAEYRRQTPQLSSELKGDPELDRAFAHINSWRDLLPLVHNDLEEAVCRFSSQSAAALRALREIPELITSVTGSGSAMFALARGTPSRSSELSALKSTEVVAQRLGCKVVIAEVKWGAPEDSVPPPG